MRKDVKEAILKHFPDEWYGTNAVHLKNINVHVEIKSPPTYFKIHLKTCVDSFSTIREFNRLICKESKKYHFPRRFKKFNVKDIENAFLAAKNIDNQIDCLIKKKKLQSTLDRMETDFN